MTTVPKIKVPIPNKMQGNVFKTNRHLPKHAKTSQPLLLNKLSLDYSKQFSLKDHFFSQSRTNVESLLK